MRLLLHGSLTDESCSRCGLVVGAANWGGAMRAYFGDRVGARKVLSSLGKDYILPPFFTTTETASAVVDAKGGRTFGHYLTNCAHRRSFATCVVDSCPVHVPSASSSPASGSLKGRED